MLRSSNSFIRLLPCLPVNSIPPRIFPLITLCRRQFLRKMWRIQFAFRLHVSCEIFLCSLTLSNTPSFLTRSVQLIIWINFKRSELMKYLVLQVSATVKFSVKKPWHSFYFHTSGHDRYSVLIQSLQNYYSFASRESFSIHSCWISFTNEIQQPLLHTHNRKLQLLMRKN